MADARGSIIGVEDSAGNVTDKNTYDAYGNPASTNVGRFQYTGQMWLAEAGVYHYKARSYDPAIGRFLQTDPIGYGDGMNMYAYAGNDPVNGSDPTGLASGQPDLDKTDVSAPDEVVVYSGPMSPGQTSVGRVGFFIEFQKGWCDAVGCGVTAYLGRRSETSGGFVGGAGGGSGAIKQNDKGHDYRTKNRVCDGQLTPEHEKDLLSRFAVPSIFSGGPVGNGVYLVTNAWGVPGGIVVTTFSKDGLAARNTTTPFHAFVGVIDRSIGVSGGATYIYTHGHGDAGRDPIGEFRDETNQKYGPGIFDQLDDRAAKYAARHYSECKK